MKRALPFAASLVALALSQPALAHPQEEAPSFRDRAPEEEIVYFVLPDRFENGDTSNDLGGYEDEPLVSGFDPTHKGFFHGGDLKGLTQRLDYLEGLGVTAIWFAPIFQNKPVQGPKGNESAGYHGYWVTDFTRPDSHFGTRAEFKAFVDAAHARGMKVYMDIITNHTADVIRYKEGDETGYVYRDRAEFPYSRKLGVDGAPINEGFLGDEVRTKENFARLTDAGSAYTPVVPAAEKDIKVPAWLNDPIYYHNRGDTTFSGESSRFGDFVGLDDLFTEHPRVLAGMIEIYGDWIRETGIDGFRIDTARHVNPEFWQTFVPEMRRIAAEQGIPNFHIFGEVYKDSPDSGYIAQYTRRDGFPAVLDFAFQYAVTLAVSGQAPPEVMTHMFDGDVLYEGGEEAARTMPTFLGNHDMGRFSTLIKQRLPDISQDELLARVKLGHAMLLTLRGSPVVYYGDEQGFVGDGNDQAAREDMFASVTDSYNDNALIGTEATTASENFDTGHPLYRLIAELSAVRKAHPALSRGKQVVRSYHLEPGLFSVSRFDPETGDEYLLAFNTSPERLTTHSRIGYEARGLETLAGTCPREVAAPGSLALDLPAFGWAVCKVTKTAE
ncbi:alpha-amylase family glycosyl hydrolase [Erythrobacter sp. HKB08]|uniref:alpha-amylase family glycosyl hydrolase n=1 Tax=Erythrobacter sp. HKB08 TaxID=2502843 RepID=UPI0010092486|nr:alpha-amylase family glycosyl hydrolase [Erythrobacter sp. HKB08]